MTSEMVNQKQSEINLIRKVFEESFRFTGTESKIYDPENSKKELETFGK